MWRKKPLTYKTTARDNKKKKKKKKMRKNPFSIIVYKKEKIKTVCNTSVFLCSYR